MYGVNPKAAVTIPDVIPEMNPKGFVELYGVNPRAVVTSLDDSVTAPLRVLKVETPEAAEAAAAVALSDAADALDAALFAEVSALDA